MCNGVNQTLRAFGTRYGFVCSRFKTTLDRWELDWRILAKEIYFAQEGWGKYVVNELYVIVWNWGFLISSLLMSFICNFKKGLYQYFLNNSWQKVSYKWEKGYSKLMKIYFNYKKEGFFFHIKTDRE